jgi:thiamine-monophosphate kinase
MPVMELEFIDWLRRRLPTDSRVRLGIGDDAALVETSRATLVTVDTLNDRVDFDLRRDSPRRIGRKALAVNLSDLAAMACRPLAAVVALTLPREGAFELARELYEGLLPLAERHQIAIAGGDTGTWDGPLAISITALGTPLERGPLVRSGARPGDRVLVTGAFGGSILGHHFDFEPRVEEALALHSAYELHAGMDVSDGLSLDLSRMAQASGCGAVLDLEKIPVAPAAEDLARQDGRSPLEHALGDGEDFELLLAASPEEARRVLADGSLGIALADIGEFVSQPGLFRLDADGSLAPLEPAGYRH